MPAGEFLTAMGGWNQVQFAEKRLPTLAELDAAAPNHPVIVYQAFTVPSTDDTLGPSPFFTGKGVAVSDTGAIAANAPSVAALNALKAAQLFADKTRRTVDAMNYAASVGLTTNVDMGAFLPPPAWKTRRSRSPSTGLPPQTTSPMYDAFNPLRSEGKMTTRLRIFFLSMDTRPDVPMLSDRLRNGLPGIRRRPHEDLGRRRVRQQLAAVRQRAATNYEAALQLIAKKGWAFQQHSLSPAEDKLIGHSKR